MTKKRKSKNITKKIRFEVFKRDNFQCKYCGKSAPDVILEVDHINPKNNGGDNSIFNLITSCFDCNRGKGKRKLSDKIELSKQKKELEKIQEEREQLKLMKKWRDEIKKIDKEYLEYFEDIIRNCGDGLYELSETGKKNLLKLIKKYEKKELEEAINISFNQYFKNNNEKEAGETWTKAFNYIERIIKGQREIKKNPIMKDVYYCRAILKNRISYVNLWQAKEMLLNLLERYKTTSVKNLCREVRNWSHFSSCYNDWMEEND